MFQISECNFSYEYKKNASLHYPFKGSVLSNGTLESSISGELRTINRGMKVRVYRNLNKPEFFSILAHDGPYKGKVCGYARSVVVLEPKLLVSEASRLRVLNQKRRNVHSYVVGYLDDVSDFVQDLGSEFCEATYNPYRSSFFYWRDTGEPVDFRGSAVIVQAAGVYVRKLTQ